MSATRIFPRVRSRHPADVADSVSSTMFSFTSFFFFFNSSILLISLFISSLRDQMIRALSQSHGKSLPLELPPSKLPLFPSPSFFLFSLNKYRFRLSELTLVSALYPFLTRIEFRTEDRSLSVAIFSEARDRFFPSPPFLSFSFFLSNDAGRRDRKCVGVFAQKGTSTKLNRYH